MIIFLVGISIIINFSNAYVLLQVRKQDNNHSNIDALIHKVVPSFKFENLAKKAQRKHFENVPQNDEYADNNAKKEISLSIDDNNPNMIKLIDTAVKLFAQLGRPYLRDQNENKSKTIKFRTGEPSMLYEISSKSLISGLKDLLSSKTVRAYLDILTKKAAVVYRAMRE